MDENYTQDDVNLRLQAKPSSKALSAVAHLVAAVGLLLQRQKRSIEYLIRLKSYRVWVEDMELDDSMMTEQYGGLDTLYTTPESQADINAQLDAMQDDGYGKQAVWVAGENAAGADAPEQGR